MKRKIIFPLILLISICKFSSAQSTNCGDAVTQLQGYAAQINNFYSDEYWRVIPNVRCPAFDQWGRPFNPMMVQQCRLQTLGYLNNWYATQCNYVNNWYAQIVRACSTQQPQTIYNPAPTPVSGGGENRQINTNQIETLTAGVDQEKTVKIVIPTNADGFRPRN